MARKTHFVGIRESSSQNTLVGRRSDYKCVLARVVTYSYTYVCTNESTPSKLSVRVHVRVCDRFERVQMQHTMWHCGLGGLTNTAIHCKSLQIPVGRTHLKNRGGKKIIYPK